MKKCLSLVLLLLLAAMMLSACGPKETVVNEEMNGQTVTLKPGEVISIELPGNPSTGYTWEVSALDQAVLKQAGEAEFKAESDLIGAPGVITLKFEAVEKGETQVKLIYHRTWEKDVAPESTFELDVVVK